ASSIFVDAATDAERVWAADMALRCRAAGVVVMDATRLDMAASRRLLLAAQCGGAIGLLARPPDEMNRLSAARTRWVVRSAPSPSDGVRWTLELIRCRDAGFTPGRAKALTLERSHETGHVGVVADVFDRSDAASRPAPRRRTA
ncbi:MAG: hypothetical protein VYC34_01100, partial [Planctomycetota bacterium]|nr:hypothetical protein [Planctomycetota bacterium]